MNQDGHGDALHIRVVIHPGFDLIAQGIFCSKVLSVFGDLSVFGVVVMPWGAGVACRKSRSPDRVTVGADPINIHAFGGDHGKAPVAGRIFDEVAAVGGADDPAGTHQRFNAASVRLPHIVSSGGEEFFQRL